jgi:hypothetical protein
MKCADLWRAGIHLTVARFEAGSDGSGIRLHEACPCLVDSFSPLLLRSSGRFCADVSGAGKAVCAGEDVDWAVAFPAPPGHVQFLLLPGFRKGLAPGLLLLAKGTGAAFGAVLSCFGFLISRVLRF